VRPSTYSPVVVCLAALVLGPAARAETLSDALRLEREGRFAESAQAFESVLAREGNSREDLTIIHAHVALLLFASGDRAGATESLLRLLEVDPDATLPDAAPPELHELLRVAAARWGGRRLDARVTPLVEGEGDEARVRVRITVRNDLADMVGGARVLAGSREVAGVRGRQPFEIALPPVEPGDGEERYTVALLDEHGGTLWTGASFAPFDAGSAAHDDATARVEHDHANARSLRILGWFLLGGGIGLVTVGGALVGVDSTPTGRTRTNADGVLLEEQLDTITGGGAVLGLGAAALVSSVVLLVIGHRRPAPDQQAWEGIDREGWLGGDRHPGVQCATFEALLDGQLD
jgi:hypothetical protein